MTDSFDEDDTGLDRPRWPARCPLIAILRGVRPDEALSHVDALLAVGFECIEVPTNSPQWERSVQAIARHVGDRALVGAGTVWQPRQLQSLVDARGRLMVTPHTNVALIAQARAAGLTTAIGCATATEAFAAITAGADVLKLFPAAALGVAHVSALRSVLPREVPLFAVGGVRPDNLAEFFRAGCQGAGLGGELYRPGQTAQQTREKADAFIAAWRAIAS
jgi:2-dehydro-3-deoxyphosphogalactonate aldolase